MSAFHDAIRAIIAEHINNAVTDALGDPIEDWDDSYRVGDYYVSIEIGIAPDTPE